MGNFGKQFQKKADGMTNEGKRQDAITRLEALEAKQQELITAQNNFVNGISKYIENIVMMVTAMSQILGVDQVAAKMKENSIAELEAGVAQSEIRFAEAVANSYLEIAETVTGSEDDLKKLVVCGTISDSTGELKHPSKFYKEYYTWKENIQKDLIDKKVGDKITLEDGSVLTVVQIYKATGKVPEQVQ